MKVLAPRCGITILIIQLFESTNSFFFRSPVFCCAFNWRRILPPCGNWFGRSTARLFACNPRLFGFWWQLIIRQGKKWSASVDSHTHSVESNLGFSLIKKGVEKIGLLFSQEPTAGWLAATHVVMMRCANYPPANDYQFCISRTFSQRLRLSGCVTRANRRRFLSFSAHWLTDACG